MVSRDRTALEKALIDLFLFVDYDNRDTISFQEWVNVFDSIDAKNTGVISRKQWQIYHGQTYVFDAIVNKKHLSIVSRLEWVETFESVDLDHDGIVSIDEWVVAVINGKQIFDVDHKQPVISSSVHVHRKQIIDVDHKQSMISSNVRNYVQTVKGKGAGKSGSKGFEKGKIRKDTGMKNSPRLTIGMKTTGEVVPKISNNQATSPPHHVPCEPEFRTSKQLDDGTPIRRVSIQECEHELDRQHHEAEVEHLRALLDRMAASHSTIDEETLQMVAGIDKELEFAGRLLRYSEEHKVEEQKAPEGTERIEATEGTERIEAKAFEVKAAEPEPKLEQHAARRFSISDNIGCLRRKIEYLEAKLSEAEEG